MLWMKTVVREVYGLFVDDGWFAATILVWLGLVWLVQWRLRPSPWIPVVLLFAGLAAILVESTVRFARSRR